MDLHHNTILNSKSSKDYSKCDGIKKELNLCMERYYSDMAKKGKTKHEVKFFIIYNANVHKYTSFNYWSKKSFISFLCYLSISVTNPLPLSYSSFHSVCEVTLPTCEDE